MTEYGVYLLVYNSKKLVRQPLNAREYLTFWLRSLEMHAPGAPVVLVGTYCASINGQEETDIVKNTLDEIVDNCDTKIHARFAVENSTGEGIGLLRECLEQVIRDEPYLQFPVAISWMKALDRIVMGDENWLSLKQVTEIFEECCTASSAKEVETMLTLFHELGVLLYFKKSESLKQIITTRPQWLVDCISCVIRDKVCCFLSCTWYCSLSCTVPSLMSTTFF